jgi:CRP/FNR family transcriptional regulator, cyclic AMP receptor protein
MLSTTEKKTILRSINLFAETPDDVLAEVADLLQELTVPPNETIFEQGDHGDAM